MFKFNPFSRSKTEPTVRSGTVPCGGTKCPRSGLRLTHPPQDLGTCRVSRANALAR